MKITETNPLDSLFQYLATLGLLGLTEISTDKKIDFKARDKLFVRLKEKMSSPDRSLAMPACKLVMIYSPIQEEQIAAGLQIIKFAEDILAAKSAGQPQTEDRRELLIETGIDLSSVKRFCLTRLQSDSGNPALLSLQKQTERLKVDISHQLSPTVLSEGRKRQVFTDQPKRS